MQKEANLNEIAELCFIYNERNKLNVERNKARYKRKYLLNIKRAWIVHFKFEKSHLLKKLKSYPGLDVATLENEKKIYLKCNPLPVKYKKMQLSDINLMILKLEKIISDMKVMTAIHTKKSRHRVLYLIKNTQCHPKYIDGGVQWIDQWSFDGKFIKRMSKEYVEILAHRFQLNSEIDNILGV
jgi:hypothetical protein